MRSNNLFLLCRFILTIQRDCCSLLKIVRKSWLFSFQMTSKTTKYWLFRKLKNSKRLEIQPFIASGFFAILTVKILLFCSVVGILFCF